MRDRERDREKKRYFSRTLSKSTMGIERGRVDRRTTKYKICVLLLLRKAIDTKSCCEQFSSHERNA